MLDSIRHAARGPSTHLLDNEDFDENDYKHCMVEARRLRIYSFDVPET